MVTYVLLQSKSQFLPRLKSQVSLRRFYEDSLVRLAFVKRLDYTPSPEQIERGLADSNEDVRHAWQERLEQMAQEAQDELLALDAPGGCG